MGVRADSFHLPFFTDFHRSKKLAKGDKKFWVQDFDPITLPTHSQDQHKSASFDEKRDTDSSDRINPPAFVHEAPPEQEGKTNTSPV